jgi:hypothetical protein
MDQKSDYRRPGEKENEMLLVKLTKTQKQRIRMLTDASGYKSISDFVRFTLLNPTFEQKFNELIQYSQVTSRALIKIMEELQNGTKY